MINIKIRKVGLFSNEEKGILNPLTPYGVYREIKGNVPLYLYIYNPEDLVEVEFRPNHNLLEVFCFFHSPKDTEEVVNRKQDEILGKILKLKLENERILFDVVMQRFVSFSDFQVIDDPYLFRENHAFVVNCGKGIVYGKGKVIYYSGSEVNIAWDNSLFALFNQLHNISAPRDKRIEGNATLLNVLLSGMLSGAKKEDFEMIADIGRGRYVYCIAEMDLTSTQVENKLKKLKTQKFMQLLTSRVETKEKDKGAPRNDLQTFTGTISNNEKDKGVYGIAMLSGIVAIGLNIFCQSIKFPDEVVCVEIDVDQLDFKLMYIQNGMAYIVPGKSSNRLEHYMELLNSDNVCFIMS